MQLNRPDSSPEELVRVRINNIIVGTIYFIVIGTALTALSLFINYAILL